MMEDCASAGVSTLFGVKITLCFPGAISAPLKSESISHRGWVVISNNKVVIAGFHDFHNQLRNSGGKSTIKWS